MTEPKKPKDEDMENVMVALMRAAKKARQVARQTGTGIAYIKDGKIVTEIPPAEPGEEAEQR